MFYHFFLISSERSWLDEVPPLFNGPSLFHLSLIVPLVLDWGEGENDDEEEEEEGEEEDDDDCILFGFSELGVEAQTLGRQDNTIR